MADYLVEVVGTNDLDEIEREVRFEEQSPSLFVKSSLSYHEGAFTNLVTFHEISFSEVPKEFKLLPSASAAPDGFKQYWTGTMLVAGSNKLVSAYRKS